MRKAESSTSIVIFLTILVAAMVLVVWYAQAIRPTRQVIGTVLEDVQELNQHLSNACAASVYNATYAFATGTGLLVTNTSHLCIYNEVYGDCQQLMYKNCPLAEQRIPISGNLVVRIERVDEVRITQSS